MKDTGKILSIVIPTYNRADMMLFTLSLFEDQIKRNADKVELIVCNNASSDNTERVLVEYHLQHPFFRVVNYIDYVDVGYSIVRSIENAIGKYFIIYGDDDIPAPYMVDFLLSSFERHPEIGYLCFNRLRGETCEGANGIKQIFLAGAQTIDSYETYYQTIKDFANNHQNEVGFMSVNAVLREAWLSRYKDVFPNNNIGYEFIVPYLYCVREYPVLYLQYPLCIHRDNIHQWRAKGYIYTYLGRPRAIEKQGELGIVDDWKKLYQVYQNRYNNNSFIRALLTIRDIDDQCMTYADEMCTFQADPVRILAIQRLLKSQGVKFSLYKLYYEFKIDGIRHFFTSKLKSILKKWK